MSITRWWRLSSRSKGNSIGLLSAVICAGAIGQTAREIEHQGVKRAIIVTNGEAVKDTPRPLLIVLHGRRDPTAPNRSSQRLDELSRREAFVVAYPAGLEGRWNFPAQATLPSKAGDVPADDVGFLMQLMDILIVEKVADPKRIYVSGFSNGGFMTYGLMCTISDRLAAAAAMGASMTEAQMAACRPARRVPLLALAGTADAIVPYDGRIQPDYRFRSVPETLEYWRRFHGCTTQNGTTLPRVRPDEATTTHRLAWTGCVGGEALVLYRVEGGGHTLPSLAPQTPDDFARNGRRSGDFETADVVWAFLKRWSLP